MGTAARIHPAKAATLVGTAYRDHLDHRILTALRKHHWVTGSRFVSCDAVNAAGGKRFFVRVAYHGGWLGANGREITVHFDLNEHEFRNANEESFSIVGQILAGLANTELEKLYMGFD